VGFIPDKTKADLHFVKYSLDLMRKSFLSVSRGATQDNLSLDKLLSFPIATPDVNLQKHIGEILSTYDELAENCRRRVQVLESMARMLFHEWFVRFNFPGHDNLAFIDSSLGPIPAGWEVRKVVEFVDFIRGTEPGSDTYSNEPGSDRIQFLRVGDLSKRDSDIFIPVELADGRILSPTDIAITLDGSVGLVQFGLSGAYSTGIRKVVVRDKSRLGWSFSYLLLSSKYVRATIQAHAKGATIKHASSALPVLEFVSPPVVLMERFEDLAAPLLKQILSLQDIIRNAHRTRDILLPRLMSGQMNGRVLLESK
jgi:type I restriction enzyme S subunit